MNGSRGKTSRFDSFFYGRIGCLGNVLCIQVSRISLDPANAPKEVKPISTTSKAKSPPPQKETSPPPPKEKSPPPPKVASPTSEKMEKKQPPASSSGGFSAESFSRPSAKPFAGVRVSKFRHTVGTVMHPSTHIDGVRGLALNVPGSSNGIHV